MARPTTQCQVELGGECASPDRRKWHFDRSINVPTVIAIVTMLLGAFGYIMQQNQRATRSEARIDTLDRDVQEVKGDIKSGLQRMENKIDKINDRMLTTKDPR